MLFLRVIAWCGAEKFSLKKSCFYLYIRRGYECYWTKTVVGTVLVLAFLVSDGRIDRDTGRNIMEYDKGI